MIVGSESGGFELDKRQASVGHGSGPNDEGERGRLWERVPATVTGNPLPAGKHGARVKRVGTNARPPATPMRVHVTPLPLLGVFSFLLPTPVDECALGQESLMMWVETSTRVRVKMSTAKPKIHSHFPKRH